MAKAVAPPPAGEVGLKGAGVMFGAYVRPRTGWAGQDQRDAIRAVERTVGRKLAIDHVYLPWGAPLGSWRWRAGWDLAQDRVPMVTFGAHVDTREVARGTHDDYLDALAASLRSLGEPVFLRYGPQPDLPSSQSWVHSAADYVAAWRHVVDRFAGAPGVWVWSPSAGAFGGAYGGVQQYWPGDAYVDWIGAAGYNGYACKHSRWRELADIFQPFYAWGSAKGKPLMIAETGSTEDPADPGRKARWFDLATNALSTSMRNVKAVVYQDSTGQCSWWPESSDAALDAFTRMAQNPWFQLEPTEGLRRPPSATTITSVPTTSTAPRPTSTTTSTTTIRTTTTSTTTGHPSVGGGDLSAKLVPRSGVLWGSSSVSDALETKLGRRFDISHTYHDWNDVFPNAGEQARAANGTTLQLSWVPRFYGTDQFIPWRNVANGSEDPQIDKTAAHIKAFGKKVFLSFHIEPESRVGTYGSVSDYAAAWRHVHDRFARDGVSNVVWVWNVVGYGAYYSQYLSGLYPGDAYVDWIAWDPYNWYVCHKSAWISFGDKVSQFYGWLMGHGFGDKPFMLAEYGSREHITDPKAKVNWFGGIVPALKSRLPNIRAVVYFNNGTANPGCDWRVDTSQAALLAFARAGQDPYVQTR
jgi:beta-mannanase